MFGQKYLKFDLEAMETAIADLGTAIEDLETIQENLQKTMDALIDSKGWDSAAGSAFTENYNTTWVAGIKDRTAIMQRMLDHLEFALEQYTAVKEEAEALTLNID